MTRYCAIKGCKSTEYKKGNGDKTRATTFFRFPKNPFLQRKWIEIVVRSGRNRDDVVKNSNICGLHFEENCIQKNGFAPSRLKADAVPTLLLNESIESYQFHVADTKGTLPDTCQNDTPFMEAEGINEYEEEVAEGSEQHVVNISRNIQLDPSTYQTPAKKRMSYAGDIISDDPETMSLQTLKKSVTILQRSCIKKDVIINRLRVQRHRQKKKIESLKILLHKLHTKSLLSSTASDTVKAAMNESTIFTHIENGKVEGSYSPDLREFALTVHFYSPKAYRYIRQVFKNKLPAPSTVRQWYSTTSGLPSCIQ